MYYMYYIHYTIYIITERFASLETQLSNLQKMVVDGGMGPLSISTDPIKVLSILSFRISYKPLNNRYRIV